MRIGIGPPARSHARRRQLLEALESAGTIGAFALFGLSWAALASPAPARPPVYPSQAMPPRDAAPSEPTPRLWLLDGFNVLHAGILGGRERSRWWTRERRGELLERAEHFDDGEAEIWVVFDGPGPAAAADGAGRVRPVFAPSADEWLLRRVRDSEDPAHIAVVTADRRLASRARHRGACVVAPRAFLARCGGVPATP